MILILDNYFIIFQFLVYLVSCKKNEIEYNSLLLTLKDREFYFTKSNQYDSKLDVSTFPIPKQGKTYHFCPCEEIEQREMRSKAALCYKKRIKLAKKVTNGNKCQKFITSILVKVENPNDLKKNWNNTNLKLYHSGFLIYIRDLDSRSIIDTIWGCGSKPRTNSEEQKDIKPRYEQWNYEYKFMIVLAIYYDTKLGQSKAVEYELLSIPEYYTHNELREYSFEERPPLGKPNFYEYTSYENDINFLNEKIGNWKKYIEEGNRELGNLLSAVALGPAQHFQVPVLQKAIVILSNLSIMWYEGTFKWYRMDTFLRYVAKQYGDLKITAGNTGIMSLPYAGDDLSQYIDGDRNKPKLIPLQDEGKITVPNYIWKTIEFLDNDEWYGIMVVMHINIFNDQTENICDDICKSNGWLISNSDYTKGKMYCCAMTNNNIAKLNADFLSLNERIIFNLYKWQQEYSLLVGDFSREFKL